MTAKEMLEDVSPRESGPAKHPLAAVANAEAAESGTISPFTLLELNEDEAKVPVPPPIYAQYPTNQTSHCFIGQRFELGAMLNNEHPYCTEYDGFDTHTGLNCILEKVDLEIFYRNECPEIAQRLINNAQQYQQLSHENLFKLIEVIYDPGIMGSILWLVWESPVGYTLLYFVRKQIAQFRQKARRPKKNPLSAEIFKICTTVGKALHYLHINGLSHGELTMQSIIINDNLKYSPPLLSKIKVKTPLASRLYVAIASYSQAAKTTAFDHKVLNALPEAWDPGFIPMSPKGDQFLLAGILQQLCNLDKNKSSVVNLHWPIFSNSIHKIRQRQLINFKVVLEKALKQNPDERFSTILEFVEVLELNFASESSELSSKIALNATRLNFSPLKNNAQASQSAPCWLRRMRLNGSLKFARFISLFPNLKQYFLRCTHLWTHPSIQLDQNYAEQITGNSSRSMTYDLLLPRWLVRALGATLYLSLLFIIAAAVHWAAPRPDILKSVGEYRPQLVILPPSKIGTIMISRTQINQEQFAIVMNRSLGPQGTRQMPMTEVSMWDAAVYCNRLSIIENLNPCYVLLNRRIGWPLGRRCDGYRLPTYNEWIYAVSAHDEHLERTLSGSHPISWQARSLEPAAQPMADTKLEKLASDSPLGAIPEGNSWGLHFDRLVAEFVWLHQSVLSIHHDDGMDPKTGGEFLVKDDVGPKNLPSDFRFFMPRPNKQIGFRIARTYSFQ